jgi:hypothetical protein
MLQITTTVGKDTWKKEILFTVGKNVNQCNHYGEKYGGSLKTKNRLVI